MISIIVPVYNVADYLPQCLDSLVSQTYRDIEIICVNDGSTDRSLAILEEYTGRDERISVVNRENKGISASRNEALSLAKGEWVMFVDSDDWIDEDACRTALDAAYAFNADLVMWAYTREYADRSLPKYYFSEQIAWDETNISSLHRRMVGPVKQELRQPDTLDACGTIWGKLYRRSLIEQGAPARFVDTQKVGSAEDVLFNIDYLGRIRKAVYQPVAMYHYRKDNASFTSRHKDNLPKKWDELYSAIKRKLQEQSVFDDFEEAYYNRISLGIIGLGLNEVFAENSLLCKYRRVSDLLERSVYRQAVRTLPLRYFPAHWYVFFFLAKRGFAFGVLAMLMTIKRIIER